MMSSEYKERIAVSPGKLKVEASIENNEDRSRIVSWFRGSGLWAGYITPVEINDLYNELKDARLTAFVLGITTETVDDVLAGELFPKGLRFRLDHLSEVLGLSKLKVRSTIFALYGEGRLHTKKITHIEAKEIMKFNADEIFEAKYTMDEILEILPVGIGVVSRLFPLLGIKGKRGRGRDVGYKKSTVDTIKSTLIKFSMLKITDVVKKVYTKGGKNLKLNTPSTFVVEGVRFYFMPSEYEDIVRGVYCDGMRWEDYERAIVSAFEDRNTEILEEIKKTI